MALGDIYDTGTVVVTNGSTTVEGLGVVWSDVKQGDILYCAGYIEFISSVDAYYDTITLQGAWLGPDVSGSTYRIHKLSWQRYSPAEDAKNLAALLTSLAEAGVIFSFTGATPSAQLGDDGQYAINTATNPWLFFKKVSGVWVDQGLIGGGAPADAEYIVGTATDDLPYARILADGGVAGSIVFDWSASGQVFGDLYASAADKYLYSTGANTWAEGSITAAGRALIGGDAVIEPSLAAANIIINGAMEVAQRGTTAITTTDGYPVDRTRINFSGWSTATWSAQQVTDAPDGFDYSLKVTATAAEAAPGASAYTIFTQRVEGQRMKRLRWGTTSAVGCVIGFWIKSSRTGVRGVSIRNNALDNVYIASITVAAANTWEWKTIAVPARTTGTWLGTTNLGLTFAICVAAGSSMIGTTGWGSSNVFGAPSQDNLAATLNATLQITGLCILPGTYEPQASLSPSLFRPYREELMACQPYFTRIPARTTGSYDCFGMGQAISTTQGVYIIILPAVMRSSPTLAFSAAATFVITNGSDSAIACTAIAANVLNFKAVRVLLTVASGLTAGQGSSLFRDSTDDAHIDISSEL